MIPGPLRRICGVAFRASPPGGGFVLNNGHQSRQPIYTAHAFGKSASGELVSNFEHQFPESA